MLGNLVVSSRPIPVHFANLIEALVDAILKPILILLTLPLKEVFIFSNALVILPPLGFLDFFIQLTLHLSPLKSSEMGGRLK